MRAGHRRLVNQRRREARIALVSVMTGGAAVIAGWQGTGLALTIAESTGLHAADWYCYAAPANEWACTPEPIDGRVPVYVGPESGIQPAIDATEETFNDDAILNQSEVIAR